MNKSIHTDISDVDDERVSQSDAYRKLYFQILFYNIFYDYFHVDRDMTRKQFLRYRQHI